MVSVWGCDSGVLKVTACQSQTKKDFQDVKFPLIVQDEMIVMIDWNESIDLQENSQRIQALVDLVWLWGGSLNILTMIGIIVMSGVIINDSILKVDTINNLRKAGMGLKEAIYRGGSRMLKPIIW